MQQQFVFKRLVVKSFIQRDFNPQVLRISADILTILAQDNPIVAFLPLKHLKNIRESHGMWGNLQNCYIME